MKVPRCTIYVSYAFQVLTCTIRLKSHWLLRVICKGRTDLWVTMSSLAAQVPRENDWEAGSHLKRKALIDLQNEIWL